MKKGSILRIEKKTAFPIETNQVQYHRSGLIRIDFFQYRILRAEHERRIAGSVDELMSTFGPPKTRKRGGVRHKKSSTPIRRRPRRRRCASAEGTTRRHRVPAGQLCLKGFKSWLIASKVRNRLARVKNGNTAYWGVARLSFLLGLVPLVPLVYRTEQELEQTVSVVLESAATATGEVLDEFGSSARQVVRVLSQSILFVFLAILWAVTRTCRNRLMHALVGNIPCKLVELSKEGESVWEVIGFSCELQGLDQCPPGRSQCLQLQGVFWMRGPAGTLMPRSVLRSSRGS